MAHLKPIRVLHVVKSLGIGGTEKTMQLMAENLDRSRFEVFVFSPRDGERRAQLKAAGVPVYLGWDLYGALERLRPDVVHVHRGGWPEPGELAPLLRLRPRAVVETNVFGRLDDSPQGRVIDLHLFVSRFCLERFARHHGAGVDLARYRVLYNPVRTGAFAAVDHTVADMARPVAGRLSRDDPGKWSALVEPALLLLRAQRPDFRFLAIGAPPGFGDFVVRSGLGGSVELLPQVGTDDEIALFFGRISHLAHANDTGESFGMAIAEAMAAGLPVVTHPAQGERDNAQLELVEHGVTGLVASSAEEYAAAQAWLWRNPEQALAMGRAGREKARRLYAADVIARQLEAIYLELLEGR